MTCSADAARGAWAAGPDCVAGADCAGADWDRAAGTADASCGAVTLASSTKVESTASSAVRIEVSLGFGLAQAGRIAGYTRRWGATLVI